MQNFFNNYFETMSHSLKEYNIDNMINLSNLVSDIKKIEKK